jgi:hypothetical protein
MDFRPLMCGRCLVHFEAGEFEMSSGPYLATYLVGRQRDRRYQVTVNNPNGAAKRVADFATIEEARAWVRNQVLAANQGSRSDPSGSRVDRR